MAGELRKIVSGGQTGVDRAALDWALASGVPCGGGARWAAGRRTGRSMRGIRCGRRPGRSAQRTEWNIRDSDGTLIVTLARRMSGGTLLTAGLARRLARPLLHLAKADSPAAEQAESLRQFIGQHEIRVLNVAGPRESGEPGVGEFVAGLLEAALGREGGWQN